MKTYSKTIAYEYVDGKFKSGSIEVDEPDNKFKQEYQEGEEEQYKKDFEKFCGPGTVLIDFMPLDLILLLER